MTIKRLPLIKTWFFVLSKTQLSDHDFLLTGFLACEQQLLNDPTPYQQSDIFELCYHAKKYETSHIKAIKVGQNLFIHATPASELLFQKKPKLLAHHISAHPA